MDVDLVTEVVERMRLFPLGLTETDVRALTILADRMPRGVSVAELCRALNISPSQYTGMLEPYLRLLNFVETLSRRVLRPEGLAYLSSFNRDGNVKVA